MQALLTRSIVHQCPHVCFYVLLPESAASYWKSAFDHERIQLLLAPFPPKQAGGAFYFNSSILDQLMDLRKMDVDLLFLNQPELTPAFLDYFNKRHFFHVPALSYIHWIDWRRYDAIKNGAAEPAALATLTGALVSAKVACNSTYGRERILRLASRWFADDVLDELAAKIVPLRPAVDARELLRNRSVGKNKKIKIVVPHRTQKYTGFKTLVENYLPQVWNIRRDFEVIITNPSRYDFVARYQEKYPFLKVVQLNRAEYYKELWEADIVIGSHVGCNQWSVATLEALCANCIPLLSSEGFYQEMLEPLIDREDWPGIRDRWFYFRSEFANRLVDVMDNLEREREQARVVGQRARKYYDWKTAAKQWEAVFQSVAQTAPMVGEDSEAFNGLVRHIRRRGKCTKAELLREMGWHPKSRHIPWTKYRRRLLTVADEMPNATEVIFSCNGRSAHRI